MRAPIPMEDSLHHVENDAIQFNNIKSHFGNQYATAFTEWPELFATKDQTALTVAVKEKVCHHVIQSHFLSDCGVAFGPYYFDDRSL